MSIPRVIQITQHARLSRDVLLSRVAAGGGRFAVQLRDPALDARTLAELGRVLRRRTRAAGAQLIVNDRLDIARWLGADGVHLGRRSVCIAQARAFMGPTLVMCSAHSVEEAVARAQEGANAVLLSPVFASPGKTKPLGLQAIVQARARMPSQVALIALGGLDLPLARSALAAGADGVASIRADLTSLTGAEEGPG